VSIFFRDISRRERDELSGVVEPLLCYKRLDEVAVGVDDDPAADL
jgi:hypothetical protein